MKHGHHCTIITHDEFQEWVEGKSSARPSEIGYLA